MKARLLRQVGERTLRGDPLLRRCRTRRSRAPASGRISPASNFIVVLLPAPFGPTISVTSPSRASKGKAAQDLLAPVTSWSVVRSDHFWRREQRWAGRPLGLNFPEPRGERRRIFDRAQPGNDGAFVREAQKFQGGTLGEKRDRGKVAPQNAKRIEFAVRQIVDPIAIEIDLQVVRPKNCRRPSPPRCSRKHRAAGFDGMQIAGENIFRETVPVGVRAEPQPDVIVRHPIAGDSLSLH